MNIKIPIFLFSLALIIFSVSSMVTTENGSHGKEVSSRVNLALRQVGHQLLSIEGDDSTTVAPIQQINEYDYLLQINSSFNYDTLPFLMDVAFDRFEVPKKYMVMVHDCTKDSLILGYNHLSFLNRDVACTGREQKVDCVNINVALEPSKASGIILRYLSLGLGLLGLIYLLFVRRKDSATDSPPITVEGKEHIIKMGQSVFDHQNQQIDVNNHTKSLTFRENKLLLLFAKNQNMVIERDNIVAEIWGDEGVIVGRSLDVFVSRLRKILKEDKSLSIKNVHGVGYRLEASHPN